MVRQLGVLVLGCLCWGVGSDDCWCCEGAG